jgi:hypothetical protein
MFHDDMSHADSKSKEICKNMKIFYLPQPPQIFQSCDEPVVTALLSGCGF